MTEKHYDFRKRLDSIHQKHRRDVSLSPLATETVIGEGWTIRIPEDASSFLENAARDLADYLFTSMELSVGLARGGFECPRSMVLSVDASLKVRRSFRLSCGAESLVIAGADERGCAMGVYYVEDVMSLREAPFVPQVESLLKEPLFSPRMVHSAYGMDIFSLPYLKRIAHEGFDTLLVFVKDLQHGHQGVCDFNEVLDMAEQAGLDVYFYSTIANIYHPDDTEAARYYEAQYGGLFRRYPKAKGLVMVGESCRFPSHDPHTTQAIASQSECCFHSGKPNPGWWPCEDFPQFVELIQKSVHRVSPEVDIVFWTYNWGYAPEELRTRLVDHLPPHTSVLVNYSMQENVAIWGTQERTLDYTLSRATPGPTFLSEGKAVARRPGELTFYTMSNSGGRTWDIGAAPYLPAPQQWGRLMENLLRYRREWRLTGLMESHHYGMFPSIISELGHWLFWSNGPKLPELLTQMATRDFSAETASTVVQVWQDWSDAIAQFITPIEDQYGPCRVGPSYPFIFSGVSLRQTFGMAMKFPWTPFNKYEIAFPEYTVVNDPMGLDMGARRVSAEIRHLPEVIGLWDRGADTLEALLPQIAERKRESARRMIGVARFIARTLTTTLNIKRWWRENHRLVIEEEPAKATEILNRIVVIAQEELDNVRQTIPLVEADSSLGYEPSMDYVTDVEHLEWKIRQLTSVLERDIPYYRQGIQVAEGL